MKGNTLIFTLVFMAIFLTLAGGMVSLVVLEQKLNLAKVAHIQALEIAESGVNYYAWHLAHDTDDYQNGTEVTGPYEIDYYDPQGSAVGKFSLNIIPPEIGSSIVTIESTGWTLDYPNIKRTVKVRYGEKSLTQYSTVSDSDIRFGADTNVYGVIHSNGGIRFDGVAHNVVRSFVNEYDDPDENELCDLYAWDPNRCPGVWTSLIDESSVFLAGKEYPVGNVNFSLFTTDLNEIKNDADNNSVKINNYLYIGDGIYLKKSNSRGYHLKLYDNHKLDIFRVTNTSGSCDGSDKGQITNESTVSLNVDMPENGLIFVEDNLWIEGQINGDKLTIAAAKLPEPGNTETCDDCKNIYLNNNLLYTNKDGSDILGLISQNDIKVGLYSENNLEIDAALVAQYGAVSRDYFSSNCSNTYYKRDTITIYGSIATHDRYGFSWICSEIDWCSGYHYRDLIYDPNLLYGPPPSFPTSGETTFISWEEVQ